MRRAAIAIVTTTIGLVLLLSFKTHSPSSAAPRPAAIAAGTGSSSPASPAPSSSASSHASSGSSGSSGSSSSTRTVTGDAADTQFGPVQVRVQLTGSRITAVDAVEYPTGTPRDQQINAYAIPVLDHEVLDANSAHIDMVSGATFTSYGYLQSLQSALDKAGHR